MAYQPMPGHFCDINKNDSRKDSRIWLKNSGGSPSTKPPIHDLQITRHRKGQLLTRRHEQHLVHAFGIVSIPAVAGVTQTMYKPSVYQNSLQAVAFPQHLSGYKDPLDYSHKSDKSAYIRSAARWLKACQMCQKLSPVCVALASTTVRVWSRNHFTLLVVLAAAATTKHMAPLMTSLSSSEMECQLMPEGSLESR